MKIDNNILRLTPFSLKNERIIFFVIFFAGILFFIQGLNVHGIEYRDDEIFYVRSTQEMLHSGNIFSPVYFGENRFQKPILFYWLILLSYKLFGEGWFAARFVAVIFSSLTLAVSWLLAKDLFDRKTATISVLILATLPLFFRHAKNAVPDMALNFFIVFAIFCMIRFFANPSKEIYSRLFFVSCALGFMVKGFAALVVPFLTTIFYALSIRRPNLLKRMNFVQGVGTFLLIVLPWFIYMFFIHGEQYANYVLKAETLNRVVSVSGENIFIKIIKTFKTNSLFYLKTMLSYFAPWSVFGLFALPVAFLAWRKKEEKAQSFLAMLIWFAVVFLFFSLIFAKINHLILVLTTPFAILLSYFFLKPFNEPTLSSKIIFSFRRYFGLYIIAAGFAGISFVQIFFLNGSKLWLIFFLLVFICIAYCVHRGENFILPMAMGVLFLSVFSQSNLLSKARLTTHSSWQVFADLINGESKRPFVIGVGSHDIHEKEFQIYFDQKVEKLATSSDEESKGALVEFFKSPQIAYCLITESDYKKFSDPFWQKRVDIIKEDMVFRKRLNLGKDFFVSVLKLDRDKINNYLKEKIILLKKPHA